MNPTFVKAIAALVPTLMLLVGSMFQFSRRKRKATVFQLIGSACFMVVVIAHVCEALGWFLWMHWGLERLFHLAVNLIASPGLGSFSRSFMFPTRILSCASRK